MNVGVSRAQPGFMPRPDVASRGGSLAGRNITRQNDEQPLSKRGQGGEMRVSLAARPGRRNDRQVPQEQAFIPADRNQAFGLPNASPVGVFTPPVSGIVPSGRVQIPAAQAAFTPPAGGVRVNSPSWKPTSKPQPKFVPLSSRPYNVGHKGFWPTFAKVCLVAVPVFILLLLIAL